MVARFILFSICLALIALGTPAAAQSNLASPMSCRFQVPANVEIECFRLNVPENRNDPDSDTIMLSIAILRNPTSTPEPEPIIFLQGGPGGETLSNLNRTFVNRFQPLFETNRDIILFDQRGIGTSRPALTCTDYQRAERELLDYEFNGQMLLSTDIKRILQQSLIVCGHRLANMHDLSGYNSIESAADIEAIRLALGYEQVNLWGISYGTRLALTAMRDYPDSFRRVVLDSVYPLEANLYTELPVNFNRSLRVLFDACRNDLRCDETFPDLEVVLYETVSELHAYPVRFDAPNPYTNELFEGVVFDGNTLLRTTFQLLYASDLLPYLPQLIYQASERDFNRWAILVGWIIAQREGIATGMNYAVQCQEEIAFTEPGSIAAAWDAYPEFAGYQTTIDNTNDLTAICQAFDAGQPAPDENNPITSAIPTLILAGEYDPVTPPGWAEQVHSRLSNSIFYSLPHRSHGVSGSRGCAQSILLDFFNADDPTDLDDDCIGDIQMVFSGTIKGDFLPLDSAFNAQIGVLNRP